MNELKKAIERVLGEAVRGRDEVLVTRAELAILNREPGCENEDYTVDVALVETEALEHLREVYSTVKERL